MDGKSSDLKSGEKHLKREMCLKKKRSPWGSHLGLWHFYKLLSLEAEIPEPGRLDPRALIFVDSDSLKNLKEGRCSSLICSQDWGKL